MQTPLINHELINTLEHSEIRYSQVWEDFRCIEKSIPAGDAQKHLLIGSAGCNAFNMLLTGGSVEALDINFAQLALIELKRAAIQHLAHPEFLKLLGFYSGGGQIYSRLRPQLSKEVCSFFDQHTTLFEDGLIHSGRLEKFFVHFREKYLRALCPSLCSSEWLSQLTLEAQREWLTTLPWEEIRQVIGSYFNEAGLTRGRSPAQMKYVTKTNTGDFFYHKLRARLDAGLIAENFYLFFFLTGQPCAMNDWPIYLREENFHKLRERLPNLRLVHSSLESYLEGVTPLYDSMILSDIFEYMSLEHSAALFRLIADRLKPAGRLAFWNLLVERTAGEGFVPLERESAAAVAADRLWFYDTFHVYQKDGR